MNLTRIKLSINGAHAWATVSGPLTSGMVGIPVTIEYDEAWDGLTKNLMCRCSPWGSNEGEVRTILNVGENAAVAHEVMQPDMFLHLGIEGFNDDGTLVIPTTWARCGKIEYGANTCDDPSTDPGLSVWNQLQVEMEQTKAYVLTPEQAVNIQSYAQTASQAAQEARQAAEEAKQTVESGLYYIPSVSQPTDTTLKFEFKPSVTGAPVPKPVTVTLPVGEGSGERADVTVDAEMSDESTNPVQNKVAKAYVDALAALLPDYGHLKGLKYAAWGDSIVDMQGTLTAPETFGDTGYTTDLQGRDISAITVAGYVTAIERRYGLVATNYGKGGHTIVGDYSSIVGMDYSDVALVTIAYGVNDARTGVPLGTVNSVDPTTFAGALNLILKKIYNDNPECRVLVLTPIQRLYVSDFGIATPNANGNYLIDFCRMCEKVAAKRATACINMYEQCGINQTNLYYYTVEGVHPVNQGFARMTNAIIPVLDGMFALPYDPIGSMTNSGDEEPDEPENGDGTEETPEEDPVGEAVDLTGLFVYDGIIYDCYVAEPNTIGSDAYNASSTIVCTGPIELTPGKVYTVVSYLGSTGVYFGLVNGSADRQILNEETGDYTANRVNDVVLKNAGLQIHDVAQSVTEVEIDGATYRKLTATIAPTTTRYLWLGGLRSMQDKITLTVV